MNVLDLFSGIGGFSLGLERAGMRTVAFCEIDPYCRKVLAKHWPGVPVFEDVTKLAGSDVGAIDVICGGFPCQDISRAGKGAGIGGARSGLWREYARIIGEVRPRFVIVENVSALLNRGLDRVLGDLAEIGFDAEWHCIRAADVGAPHLRDRIWIVAYPQYTNADRERPHRAPLHINGNAEFRDEQERQLGSMGEALADSDRCGWEAWQQGAEALGHGHSISSNGRIIPDANRPRLSLPWSESLGTNGQQSWRVPSTGDWWAVEPDVGRVAHGIPGRVDRLRQLGNSVVPQIPEIIGRAIMKSVSLASQQREAL